MAITENQAKLIEAARYGSDGGLKFFLKRGTPVDGADEKGWTALHWAAYKGTPDCVALLVGASADANARNEDGDTPLHVAARLGHLDVQRALIKAGADIKASNAGGLTPADLAKARAP